MIPNNHHPFDSFSDEYMTIKIFVDSDDAELKAKYYEAAVNHNKKILSEPNHYDAGFDLFLPERIDLEGECNPQVKVDYKIKCCAHINKQFFFHNSKCMTKRATAFYTYGRSSISGTRFRLANNQGIIDAGYRGNLMAKMDLVFNSNYPTLYEKYTRLMQICAPGLVPIYVEIVDTLEDLGEQTKRGTGGFGSTGV